MDLKSSRAASGTASAASGTEQRPLSTQNSTYSERWKLTLEQVMSIALQNSQIIRSIAQVQGIQPVGQTAAGQPQSLTLNPDFSQSIYEPSIEATDDNRGVEAALANFDVQLQTSFTWDRTDRPQNVRENDITAGLVFARLLERDNINYQSELSKRTASGTQWRFKSPQ